MRSTVIGIVVGVAVALGATVPAAVAQSVTCSHENVVDELTIESTPFPFTVVVDGQNIEVRVSGTDQACSGSQATVHNTTRVVGGDGSIEATIDLRGGPFAPGAVNEAGFSDEVEFDLDVGTVKIEGKEGPDLIRIGTGGVNLNPSGEGGKQGPYDPDVLLSPAGTLRIEGNTGDDTVSGIGGLGTGSEAASGFSAAGDDGTDLLEGGAGSDSLSGGVVGGSDTLRGRGGDDNFFRYPAIVEGGAGSDTFFAQSAMTLDLTDSGPQDTGAGIVTFTAIENLEGSPEPDTLKGDSGANRLHGGPGDDTVLGGGGADTVFGGWGSDVVDGGTGDDALDGGRENNGPMPGDVDTVSYASAPAGVVVDLAVGVPQDTGGAGNDTITRFANLTGSPFGDTLRGTDGPDRVDALGGVDNVTTLAGEDVIDVRDGLADTVDCGASADSVDGDSIDSLTACETTELVADINPPETTIDAGPAGVTPDTQPAFQFSSSEPGSSFLCQVDDEPVFDCASPMTIGPLSEGAHVFRVRARDATGNTDDTPATRSFTVDVPEPPVVEPAIERFTVKPRRFRAGKRARFRFALSAPAPVEIRIKRKGKRRRVATLERDAKAGANRIRFRKLAGKKLRPGRYRATLVVFDAAGKRTDSKRVRFRVRRRGT
ncbi:MAG TPA: calcium-binding protein [Thermoleophilaceae bacterium]|nr:calcium-binding protein [Thermoleophilaceae bacterium]